VGETPEGVAPSSRDAADPLDAVVDGVRRGDRDAIAAVYLEVAPRLRAWLATQTPHGEVADDLTEQAFLELLRHHGELRGDGRALRAWLFRTARRDLYDWRKAAARRADPTAEEARLDDVPDRTPDPTDQLHDLDPRVRDAVSRLSAEHREVLELRHVADLSVAEVAAVLGRTPGAVKQLHHRALARLRALLAPSA
jgi:RNA polymerase sigma-70 factor (ECF subfamily)